MTTERLALTDSGHIRYTLKTPYRDGTTHVIFEPEDFIARLVALVPKPRAHLTRYHGVFAPASALRSRVVAGSGTVGETAPPDETEAQRHRAMTWAQRLKRVFAIDIERCLRCGGMLKVIANIEEPEVIARILAHLGRNEAAADPAHPRQAKPTPQPEPRAAARPAADLSQRDPSDPRRFDGRLRPRPAGRYPILPKTGDSVGASGEVRGPKHAHVPIPVLTRAAIVDSVEVTAWR